MSTFFDELSSLFSESNFGLFFASLFEYLPSWITVPMILSVVLLFVGSLIRAFRG